MRLTYRIYLLLIIILSSQSFSPILAQLLGPRIQQSDKSIAQNSVSNLSAFGDTVWIGPQLQRNIGNSADWFLPEQIDSITIAEGRVYSLVLGQDSIFAGIGRTSELNGDLVDEAFGFYFSQDGGDSFEFIPFQVENETETIYTYGNNSITQLPVIVPQQSPPYMVARKGDVFFASAWATGLLRSLDGGQTQERIILPPTREDSLDPKKTYSFEFNPRFDNNFLGFSVFIDSKNQVWFGSAGGVNVSPNVMVAPKDSVKWYHYKFNESDPSSISGNWVIFITEQVQKNRIWMTNWIAQSGESYGISYTENNGKTFNRILLGEKIYSIAFWKDYILAAGENGLFISKDDGISWNQLTVIRSANQIISSNARFFSVSAGSNGVWIGTSEGIVFTSDFSNFQITRVNFPLNGGNQFLTNSKSVETYAYPNPFSPGRHRYCRIVFESEANNDIEIQLLDFGMQKIRTLTGTPQSNGVYEALWDGTDQNGRLVANGVVFYSISGTSNEANGKILVID